MSLATNDVHAYLDSIYDGWFWRWSPDGSVLVWRENQTIAFRQEVFEVLRQLAPRGLPPFDAVVLLLAACRSNWFECRSQLGTAPERLLAPLDAIARLPDSLRSLLAVKKVLADQAFEPRTECLNQRMSSKVMEQLEVFQPHAIDMAPMRGTSDLIVRSLSLLATALHHVDAESLARRFHTGLDELVQPAVIEPLSDAERMNRLLATLESEGDVSGLAGLVKRLMAAITVPRPISDRDELQLGGVSDLTNRGQLDRLLLSELANDDAIFTARMALNELLFLKREAPPKDAPEYRAILLDSGLRMWGIPRVFATAAAMALLATSATKGVTRVFRAASDGLEAVDLTSVTGLTDHLSKLYADVHPGQSLAGFREQLTRLNESTLPILITVPEVMEDPDFQSALQLSNLSHLLVASVSRSGDFQLYRLGTHQRRVLCAASMSLDQLFPDRIGRGQKNRSSLRDPHALPEQILEEPHSLRIPYDLNLAISMSVSEDGRRGYFVTHDRRLLCYQRADSLGIQLASHLPPGQIHWIQERTYDGRLRAIIECRPEDKTYLLSVCSIEDTYELAETRLPIGSPILNVVTHQGYLFLIRQNAVDLLSAQGEFCERVDVPADLQYSGLGRYFHRWQMEWWCLSAQSAEGHFERVPSGGTMRRHRVRCLIDVPDAEEPLAVLSRGQAFPISSDVEQWTHQVSVSSDLVDQLVVRRVSRDAKRFLVQLMRPIEGSHFALGRLLAHHAQPTDPFCDLSGKESQVPMILEDFLVPKCTQHVRFRFSRLSGKAGDYRLALLLWDKQQARVLRLASDASNESILILDHLVPRKIPGLPPKRESAEDIAEASADQFEFQPLRPRRLGFKLTTVALPGGQRVILDSRGLLHLCPAKDTLPPLTILLLDSGELAGRLSDGRWFGPPCFQREPIEQRRISSATAFYEWIVPFMKGSPS